MSVDSLVARLHSLRASDKEGRGASSLATRLRGLDEAREMSNAGTEWLTPRPLHEFETSLDLTRKQRLAQKRAETELRKLRTEFRLEGRLDEFEEFAEAEGRTEGLGALDAIMENTVDPIFHLLEGGLYGLAGFVHELERTGSAWEGFKQASIEVASALPGIELEGEKRLTFIDVFKQRGLSDWEAMAAGMAFNMIADPINLVPGGVLAKGFLKGGKAALDRSGFVGEGLKRAFVPHYKDLKNLTDEQRTAFLETKGQFERKVLDEKVWMQDKVENMVGWMQPHERVVFGLYLDQPDRLRKVVDDLVNAKLIPEDRVPELMKRAQWINETVEDKISFAGDLFAKEVELGLIDPAMHKAFYLHGTEALDPIMRRAQEKVVKERVVRSGSREILPMKQGGLPAAGERVTGTQYDRFLKTLSGDIEASTELDIANIMLKRGTDHVRWTNWRKFLDAIATDGRIAGRIIDDANLFKDSKAMEAFKAELPAGYAILPVKRKTLQTRKVADEIEKVTAIVEDQVAGVMPPRTVRKVVKEAEHKSEVVDEVIGGYVLPEPIVDFVRKQQAAMASTEDVGDFLDIADKLTGFWRGWATFGTGYHLRNYISILNMNWIAGVGADYSNLQKGGKWPVPGEFMLRHVQGLKLQMMADGAGRLEGLPGQAVKAVNGMVKQLGFKSFDDVPIPEVVWNGKNLSPEDLVRLGQEFDVPQVASKLYNDIDEGAVTKIWREFGDRGTREAIENAGVIPQTTVAALAKKHSISEELANKFLNGNAIDARNELAVLAESQAGLAKGFGRQFANLDTGAPGAHRVAITKAIDQVSDEAAEIVARTPRIDEVTKAALLIGKSEPRTKGEKFRLIFGNDNPFMNAHRTFGQIVENNGRWALFLDRMIKNHSPAEAALKTKEMHFDYRNLTDIEKRLFRVFLPFYAWQRFAAPRVLLSMLDNPGRFARMPKAKEAIESLSADVGELPTPDYYDEVQAMQLPFVEDDRPLFMQLDLPVLELSRFNLKDASSSLHPIIKNTVESAVGNYSLFLGAPIEDFPGESSEALPFLSRSAEQSIANLFPPFGKFLSRPARAIARGEGTEQAISELTGVRLRKLDVRRVMRARTFERRQLARDFKKKLEQEAEGKKPLF